MCFWFWFDFGQDWWCLAISVSDWLEIWGIRPTTLPFSTVFLYLTQQYYCSFVAISPRFSCGYCVFPIVSTPCISLEPTNLQYLSVTICGSKTAVMYKCCCYVRLYEIIKRLTSDHCRVISTGGLFHHCYRRRRRRQRRRHLWHCRCRRCQNKNVASSLKLRWKRTTSFCNSSRQQRLPSNRLQPLPSNNNNYTSSCLIQRSTPVDPPWLVTRTTQHSATQTPASALQTLASASRTPSTRSSLSCIQIMD